MMTSDEMSENKREEYLRKLSPGDRENFTRREDRKDLLGAGLMELKDEMPTKSDDRPDWDSWFMTLAFVVAQRSLDKHTKHGCVIVDDSHTILSVGYNSAPRGCCDDQIPLTRPEKYMFMEHAESGSIINAARSGTCIKGATFYVTGPPCHSCFGKILNIGAKKLIHGTVLHKRTQESIDAIYLMNHDLRLEVIEYPHTISVLKILDTTKKYVLRKDKEDRP